MLKAAVLAPFAVLSYVILFAASVALHDAALRPGYAWMLSGLGLAWVYAAVDAYRVARRREEELRLPAPRAHGEPSERSVRSALERGRRETAALACVAAAAAAAAFHGFARVRAVLRAAEAVRAAAIDWVPIRAGAFMMGENLHTDDDKLRALTNQQPAHPVNLKAFALARTLVTLRQYQKCVEAGACSTLDVSCAGPGVPLDAPAVCADWDQARAFAAWVGGRLPTEAEWEYAARDGDTSRAYPWGADPPTCDRAVMWQDGGGCGSGMPMAVCSKPAGNTQSGLCDMAGDAYEWVQDRYHDTYDGAPADGSAWEGGPSSGDLPRVVRGGSWYDSEGDMLMSTDRQSFPAGAHDARIGMRPARSLELPLP